MLHEPSRFTFTFKRAYTRHCGYRFVSCLVWLLVYRRDPFAAPNPAPERALAVGVRQANEHVGDGGPDKIADLTVGLITVQKPSQPEVNRAVRGAHGLPHPVVEGVKGGDEAVVRRASWPRRDVVHVEIAH